MGKAKKELKITNKLIAAVFSLQVVSGGQWLWCLLALWTEGGKLVLLRDINLIEKWGVRNHGKDKNKTNSPSLPSLC